MVSWPEEDERMCRRVEEDQGWVRGSILVQDMGRLSREPVTDEEMVHGRTRSVSGRKETDLGMGGQTGTPGGVTPVSRGDIRRLRGSVQWREEMHSCRFIGRFRRCRQKSTTGLQSGGSIRPGRG